MLTLEEAVAIVAPLSARYVNSRRVTAWGVVVCPVVGGFTLMRSRWVHDGEDWDEETVPINGTVYATRDAAEAAAIEVQS